MRLVIDCFKLVKGKGKSIGTVSYTHLDVYKRQEYDCHDFTDKNLCVLHLRCSDYMDSPELYLRKKYWLDGMKNMRKINPDMKFMIITNDVKEANKFLPGIPAYNFDLAKDYSIQMCIRDRPLQDLISGRSRFPGSRAGKLPAGGPSHSRPKGSRRTAEAKLGEVSKLRAKKGKKGKR